MRLFIMLLIGVIAMTTSAFGAETLTELYISDQPDLIAFMQQAWGQIGLDTMAFNPGEKVLPMQIGDTIYKKGLGTHANSEILIALAGRYLEFQAIVGVQRYDPPLGSAVFQVYVDGKKVFDSGLMRVQTPAKPVKISLAGAEELKLVVTDGGDGIACDMANWAEARLTPDPKAHERALADAVDMGRFGQVLSWDPDRKDGTNAGRTQEFPAEDLFMETEVLPDGAGNYTVPAKGQTGSIGLQWLEPRRVQRLVLELADGSATANGVTAEYWGPAMERGASSGSRWQGVWKPLKGEIRRDGSKLVLDIDWKGNADKAYGATKVRWIVPGNLSVKRPVAFTDSPWTTVDVVLQAEKPQPGSKAAVSVYNGDILDGSAQLSTMDWDLSQPLKLSVRYGVPKRWMQDRTSLRISLPNGAFGMAIDDLLKHKSIYVKDFGFYASLASGGESLEQYKKRTANLQTVLERVREMPDQTLAQSIEHTHRPEADLGPTMLSLAADNHKYVLHRSGAVVFDAADNPWANGGGPHMQLSITPAFGSGKNQKFTRKLDGGWMPIVDIHVQDGGLVYSQRTFVAPSDDTPMPLGKIEWLNSKPVCVLDYQITNPTAKPAQAQAHFEVVHQVTPPALIKPEVTGSSAVFMLDGKVIAGMVGRQFIDMQVKADDRGFAVSGILPAGGQATFSVYLPGWVLTKDEIPQLPAENALYEKTKSYWNRVMSSSMQVEIPDEYLADVIKANQVHCLLAARNEEDDRVSPWIASATYGPLESEAQSVIRGMMYTGNLDFAKRACEFFIKRYNPQGFLTTGYTFLGTGWHLWALGEYYSLTKDEDWMRSIAPEVARVCEWAMAQREKTKKLDSQGNKLPEWGLMPPGVLADWSVYAYYYYLNGNFSAGLKSAGAALADIGYPGADKIIRSGDELAEETLRSYRRVQALAPVVPLKDGTWVPAPPTQAYSIWPTSQMYPGSDSGRSWCYDVELGSPHLIPLGTIPPDSREARWTMDYQEDVQYLAEGWFYYPAVDSERDWFNRGGFAKVQPYYARTGEIYSVMDEVKPYVRTYINSVVSLLNREDLSLWEHFVNGAFNKTHETGYFLYQSRAMLVLERGRELWLAPFVNNNWMKNGMSVGVRNAPSQFGSVTFRITSHVNDGYIEAVVAQPARSAPDEIVLRLRHPDGRKMKSVTVNGQPCKDFDANREIVRFKPTGGQMIVRAMY